jgi:16S rRNA U1498 N3-methylase RsmE
MPDLFEATSLPDALTLLSLSPVSRGFLLSPRASQGLAQAVLAGLPDAKGTVILAIGPEGGFSPEEEKLLEDKGFQPSLLSNQILRGETAGLVAAAVALHALEFSASAEL